MASALTDKLSRLVKQVSGQARITEDNVTDMLREVRMALLEADVALPVVRDFVARVKEKAMGQDVLGSLKPGQTLSGVFDELFKDLEMPPQCIAGIPITTFDQPFHQMTIVAGYISLHDLLQSLRWTKPVQEILDAHEFTSTRFEKIEQYLSAMQKSLDQILGP